MGSGDFSPGFRFRCGCSTLGAGGRISALTSRQTSPQAAGIPDEPNWLLAVHAAESKKALDLRVLDLREITTFTDYFVICTSSNPKQSQAIGDEIGRQLKQIGELPVSVEGYETGEWLLMDYGDFLVHIFSETARSYYDLERLWRHAKVLELSEGKS